MTPQQTYRSRRAAYAEFISKQGISISESKFYADCQQIPGMVKLDKSVHLADLVAYIERERAKSPGIARGLGDISLEAKKADADYRKALADAQKAEIQVEEMQRQLDHKWIEREAADKEKATVLILLYNNISYQIQKESAEIAMRLGIDIAQREEIEIYFEEAICRAFNDIARNKLVQVEFDEDDMDAADDNQGESQEVEE